MNSREVKYLKFFACSSHDEKNKSGDFKVLSWIFRLITIIYGSKTVSGRKYFPRLDSNKVLVVSSVECGQGYGLGAAGFLQACINQAASAAESQVGK